MKTCSSILFFFFLFSFQFICAQNITSWKLQDMKNVIANASQPTVFNFWATFCQPCVKEIPYFEQLVKRYKNAGVKLVLVSLDLQESYPQKIKSFVQQRKFTSPIVYLDETNADLFCPVVDSSWSGAIPASLFVNNKTGYKKFFDEGLSRKKFEKEVQAMLQKQR